MHAHVYGHIKQLGGNLIALDLVAVNLIPVLGTVNLFRLIERERFDLQVRMKPLRDPILGSSTGIVRDSAVELCILMLQHEFDCLLEILGLGGGTNVEPLDLLAVGADVGVGALFMEFRSSAGSFDFISKLVGPDTRIEQVTVNGVPGVWLEGAPHQVFIQPSPGGGSLVSDRVRLAGNTLLWYSDGVTYRLEAKVSKARALEIAGTVGPAAV